MEYGWNVRAPTAIHSGSVPAFIHAGMGSTTEDCEVFDILVR